MTSRAIDITGISRALADSYRIEHEVGRGGMAGVFLAQDLKHNRRVAVKIIHSNLSAMLGAERFLREIEVTAALQHPHILPLFDSGSVDGRLYYVMPFVEGESLRARLDRERQLPIDDAVRIAIDVGSALDYAHRHAVVHRDIKPENILLPDGGAVVADFGIALAVREAAGQRITQSGLSLGTPQYMSPEQAAADRDIDARSDIYSVGAVLYEMLVGDPPFTGATAQVVLSKSMVDAPVPPSKYRETVPPELDHIVLRTLAKVPADRFSSAGELVAALRTVPTGGLWATATRRATFAISRRRKGAIVAGGVMLIVIGALAGRALGGRTPRADDATVRRFSIALPDSVPLAFSKPDAAAFGQRSLCITPDGRRIIYVARRGGTTQLYVRRTDDFETTPLAGTEGALMPFVSPDSRWVGFVVNNELRKLSLESGQITPLGRVENPLGAAWDADKQILIADGAGRSIVSIPADGGQPKRLMSRVPLSYGSPAALPGGRVIFSRGRRLLVADLATGAERVLTPDGNAPTAPVPSNAFVGIMPRYLAPGYLTFIDREGSLMVAPFDATAARVTGPATRTVARVRRESEVGAQYDIANDGTLVYVDGGNAQDGVLVRAAEGGHLDTLPIPPADFEGFAFSPEGRRLAAKIVAPTGVLELWVYDLLNARGRRLASVVDRLTVPVWARDGRSVVYGTGQPGVLLRIDAEHGGVPDTLYRGNFTPSDFSPDGKVLGGQITDPSVPARAALLRVDGGGTPQPITAGGATGEFYPVFSPDGRWIAFQRHTTSLPQVVAVPNPALTPMVTASTDHGVEPQWSSRGNALYYRAESQFMIVPVDASAARPFGTARVFAQGNFADFTGRSYAIAPDGGHLLLKLGAEPATVASIRVVTSWASEIGRPK